MPASPHWNDDLTHAIIACIIHVHNTLGPGFHERIYCRALRIELQHQDFNVEFEKHIPITYRGKLIGGHRLDIIVHDGVIIEAKHVERLTKADYAQTKSYLKATNLERALLVNFAGERADIRRLQNEIKKQEKNEPPE